VYISGAGENIRENIIALATDSLGYYEFKQHKSYFDTEFSKSADQRRQANLQWLQNSSQTKGDNLNSGRCESSINFRSKKEGISASKKIELETSSKNKNSTDLYRGINEFKKGYQPRTNVVKDENDDLLADSHSILNRWKLLLSVIEFTWH
jgi:hypothetical protein